MEKMQLKSGYAYMHTHIFSYLVLLISNICLNLHAKIYNFILLPIFPVSRGKLIRKTKPHRYSKVIFAGQRRGDVIGYLLKTRN